MHGLILVQLQKFAQQALGPEEWRGALSKSGLDRSSLSAGRVSAERQAWELILFAAETCNGTVGEVVEIVGRVLASD